MNRDKYQELVENAYCSKALSVEAFNPDDELDVWAELEQWSDQSAFDGKGDSVSKTEPETNEAGLKVKVGRTLPTPASIARKMRVASLPILGAMATKSMISSQHTNNLSLNFVLSYRMC